jgi:hypothetical protein
VWTVVCGNQRGFAALIYSCCNGKPPVICAVLAVLREALSPASLNQALLHANNYGMNCMLVAAYKGKLRDAGVQSEIAKIDDATMAKLLTKVDNVSGLPLCPELAHTTAAFTWRAVLHIVLSVSNAQLCAVQGVSMQICTLPAYGC